MSSVSRFVPLFVLVPFCTYLGMAAIPPSDAVKGMRLQQFARLPVKDAGRIKPIDSVARVELLLISKRQTFKDGEKSDQPAIRWFLDSLMGKGDKYPVFRIEDPHLLDMLGLKPKPQFFRYSIDELRPKIGELVSLAEKTRDMKDSERDPTNRNAVRLVNHLMQYSQMRNHLSTPTLLLIPPVSANEDWRSIEEAWRSNAQDTATVAYKDMLRAYDENNPTEFNKALAGYQSYLTDNFPEETRRAAFEYFYNEFAPFYHCDILYVVMFVLVVASWAVFTEQLNRAAFWLGVYTLVFHSCAIIVRMYLQGRPPITNLYSTAIYIGWGCVLMSLLIESLYRNGIGNLVAAVAGAGTTFIAHNLATDGDTMRPLQAVLDTNFWLATHVTIINSGYAATFVAGLLGSVFVVMGVFTKELNQQMFKAISQVIYGCVCFATLLSFTGTVLGGLWADYSWGRFWGWDPKENGALLIVLWNALILHARWGGMVRQRGIALLTIFGNIVVAWSWFGVNMLGIGLHSYGAMEGGVFWLTTYAVSQLMLITIGLIPVRHWRSFGAAVPA